MCTLPAMACFQASDSSSSLCDIGLGLYRCLQDLHALDNASNVFLHFHLDEDFFHNSAYTSAITGNFFRTPFFQKYTALCALGLSYQKRSVICDINCIQRFIKLHKMPGVLTGSIAAVMVLTCSLPDGLSVHSSLQPRMGPFGWLGGSQLTWTEVGDRASAWRDSTLLGTWTVETYKDNILLTHNY